MNRELIPVPVIERPADDLNALAKRVSEREKRNRTGQLQHVKQQAADVLAARQQAKRGDWGPWCEEAGLSGVQAWRYAEFGKLSSTKAFLSLTEDEQWAEWQRICGNKPPKDVESDDDETESEEDTGEAATMPAFVTLDTWQALSNDERLQFLDYAGTARFNDQGKNASIEWALWSWNPVTGCRHSCPYCYARDIAARFYESGFEPTLWPGRLKAPHNTPFPAEKAKEWMGHKNVFVCSMADLFGRWVPQEWIEAVLAEVRAAPQWNFLFLTKFPIRLAEFEFPDNAWVGTSVDCQARVANAEKAFRKVKAGVKWLSCEPMIEPLKFSDIGAFDWIVVGGASASTKTPEWFPPRRWVVDLIDQASAAGVVIYEKDNLWKRYRGYPGDKPFKAPTAAPAELVYLPTVEVTSDDTA